MLFPRIRASMGKAQGDGWWSVLQVGALHCPTQRQLPRLKLGTPPPFGAAGRQGLLKQSQLQWGLLARCSDSSTRP